MLWQYLAQSLLRIRTSIIIIYLMYEAINDQSKSFP